MAKFMGWENVKADENSSPVWTDGQELNYIRRKNIMNIRIKGYDRYVEEFQKKCKNPDIHPYSKMELEEMTKKACAGNKIPDVNELGIFTQTLKGKNSIDNKTHYFCFRYKTEKDGTAVMYYQTER